MDIDGIRIQSLPESTCPLLIAGFDGWGNALNISRGMIQFLIQKLKASPFARLDADQFYRYDAARPTVNIEAGIMTDFSAPGGVFHIAPLNENRAILLLEADEPNLRWFQFSHALLAMCRKLGVRSLVTVGSMYDQVLHTDTIISGIASNVEWLEKLNLHKVRPISYSGPSAVHSIIQVEGPKLGIDCISLWCHCPFYIQGTVHFGMLARLGLLLAALGDFQLDVTDLEEGWRHLNEKIQRLIDEKPELRDIVSELRKEKMRSPHMALKRPENGDGKIINLEDFLHSKE